MTQSGNITATPPTASFIIPNWNGGTLLRECLDSIDDQTTGSYEVIVVDNASTDGSIDLPHFARPAWKIVSLSANRGFAEACNVGLAQSRGDIIVLLNNDATLHPEWLSRVLSSFSASPSAGSVASRILQKDRPELLDSAGFDLCTCCSVKSWRGWPSGSFEKQHHDVFGPVATAAAYRKSCLSEVGFLIPEFFAYYEDTDLAARLMWTGHPCIYNDQAIVYHVGSATGKQGSKFQRYYLRRNNELLYWINMQGIMAIRNLPSHLLYECLCFLEMLLKGQLLTFIKAKIDFIRIIPVAILRRKMLKSMLKTTPEDMQTRRQTMQHTLLDLTEAISSRRAERDCSASRIGRAQ